MTFSIFVCENKRRKDSNFLTILHKIILLCVPQNRMTFRTYETRCLCLRFSSRIHHFQTSLQKHHETVLSLSVHTLYFMNYSKYLGKIWNYLHALISVWWIYSWSPLGRHKFLLLLSNIGVSIFLKIQHTWNKAVNRKNIKYNLKW
jgi:hypothetical protein